MLDIKFIEKNPEIVKDGIIKKGFNFDLDSFLELNNNRKNILTKIENLKAKKNKISKDIPLIKDKKEKDELLNTLKNLKEEEKNLEEEYKKIESDFNIKLLEIPNPPDPEVPVGKNETENVEYYRWGTIPSFTFTPKDHIELGLDLDLIDFERASKISGTRTYFLKNEAVLLQNALIRFTIDHLISKGFNIIYSPFFVKERAMVGTSYFPFGKEQAYFIEKDDLYLIGTSEVTLMSYYLDEIIPEEKLPIMFAGLSTCFRRQAGTYGKDTKGLYRIHQFEKVEQVIICKNNKEESDKFHQFLLKNSCEILEKLNLPYRLVKVCTGDLGAGQIKKDDIEVWMPSRNSYGETHSCSSFLDYQTRRSNIRVKTNDGKLYFPFSLNNTAIASPRILIPLIEIYQQEDGSIKVPDILIPYMNGIEKIKKK
ncbi:MAG: serine--tRNA ligase [Spirochaetes bacterium]|nr:serine--tRNA ligase [Spirochaetota bacterium]